MRPATPGQLQWTLDVKNPSDKSARPWRIQRLDAGPEHWYSKLRQVKSDKVYTMAGFSPAQGTPLCEEKFVYYDGVMRLRFVKIGKQSDGTLTLDVAATTDLLDLFVVDRDAGSRHLAVFDRLPRGNRSEPLKWRDIPAKEWETTTTGELTRRLLKAGLNADEAAVAAKIREPAFFEQQDGMSIVYRLPQPAYNFVTKITLDPLPETLVRVGLVHHPHAEPDLADRIRRLIDGVRHTADEVAARNCTYWRRDVGGTKEGQRQGRRCSREGEVTAVDRRTRHHYKAGLPVGALVTTVTGRPPPCQFPA